jgi:hypothetical protein
VTVPPLTALPLDDELEDELDGDEQAAASKIAESRVVTKIHGRPDVLDSTTGLDETLVRFIGTDPLQDKSVRMPVSEANPGIRGPATGSASQ